MNEMLYCCSMEDRSEAAGAAAELISGLGFDFSSWTDAETKTIRHTLYFPTENEAKAAYGLIVAEAEGWGEFGIEIADLKLSSLKKEDWAESWKIHFKVIEISPRLAIRPSWIDFKAKQGQALIELDPGMSFGTGQHATTKFCLKAIDLFTAVDSGSRRSLLDAGCGSGILSIAAWKLGCRPVLAFDIDPEAVMIAKENVEKNGISLDELPVATSPLDSYDPQGRVFDIVAANILSSALIAGSAKLMTLVKPAGHLILAGILDKEYGSVKAHFESLGCKELVSEAEKEWRGGAFLVPG